MQRGKSGVKKCEWFSASNESNLEHCFEYFEHKRTLFFVENYADRFPFLSFLYELFDLTLLLCALFIDHAQLWHDIYYNHSMNT